MPEISIIIRTKNEEAWIAHCLSMVYKQDFKDFEVILIDNRSTDNTVNIAKRFPIDKIQYIDKFLPGKALNQGILLSTGRYIVCLSAHCVPKNTDWLSSLLKNFEVDKNLAGVYGRQLPLSFTTDVDKRDLLIVFGRDRRIQVKDYFFHNANSMIRREVWDKFPFDKKVTNIEDRVWGKEVISAGYHIVYDPEASVYHHHGLHQGNMPKRARGVVSIIEHLDHDVSNNLPDSLKPAVVNIAAVLLVKDKVINDSEDYQLLENAISQLKSASYINTIYLASINKKTAEDLKVHWINRSNISDQDDLPVDILLSKVLDNIESNNDYPDSLMYVNSDYLNRPEGVFDELVYEAQYNGYDTVFPGFIDYGHYWLKNQDEDYHQTDESMEDNSKRQPVYRALYGLGCLTSSVEIRKGKLVGGKIGILPIDNFDATLRFRNLKDSSIY